MSNKSTGCDLLEREENGSSKKVQQKGLSHARIRSVSSSADQNRGYVSISFIISLLRSMLEFGERSVETVAV